MKRVEIGLYEFGKLADEQKQLAVTYEAHELYVERHDLEMAADWEKAAHEHGSANSDLGRYWEEAALQLISIRRRFLKDEAGSKAANEACRVFLDDQRSKDLQQDARIRPFAFQNFVDRSEQEVQSGITEESKALADWLKAERKLNASGLAFLPVERVSQIRPSSIVHVPASAIAFLG